MPESTSGLILRKNIKAALRLAERTRKSRSRGHMTLTQALPASRKSTATKAEKLNMAPKLELPAAAAVIWLLLLSLIPPAEAYDAGDAVALLLCTVLTVLGFCACLGCYARRRNGL